MVLRKTTSTVADFAVAAMMVLALSAFVVPQAFASESIIEAPENAQLAVAMVEKAQAYIQKYGKEKALAEVIPDPAHGLVNVTFHTTLGKKADVGEIVIQGASPDEANKLKGKLTSIIARLKGAAIR